MAGLLSLASKGGAKLTPEAIQAQMHLTPQQKAQLERIVLAGRKVMFSKQSHKLFLDQMQGPGTIAMKLGQGVAGLMGLLQQESHNSLPPNLIVPAGLVLLAHAADFLRQSGTEITDQEFASAAEVFINAVLHAAGLDPDKVAAAGGGKAPSARPSEAPPKTLRRPSADPAEGAGATA